MKNKMDFNGIKTIMSEQYTQTELEVMAFIGNVEKVAEMLKEKGIDPDKAGAVMELIRSGNSEAEALSQVKG